MELVFARTGTRRYPVEAHRDAAPDVVTDPAPGYDDHIPHELVHFFVEGHWRLSNGIYAARPGEVGLMEAADVVSGVTGLLKASGLNWEEYRNDVPARVALKIPLSAPGRLTCRIRCPIPFCVCDADAVTPAQATLRHAAKASRGEVCRYPAGHFGIYVGDHFERVTADQLAFLRSHAPSTAS